MSARAVVAMTACYRPRGSRVVPGRERPSRRHGDESGFSLTELIVASLILSIILGVTLVISTSVFQQASLEVASGQSASTAQSAVDTMSLYLRGTVSPADWATSNDSSTTDKACWSKTPVSDPTSTGATPPTPISYYPPVTSPTGTGGGAVFKGTTGKYTVPAPANTAIIVAHPFDMVFCAYQPEAPASKAPHVYRLWIDPATCRPAAGAPPGGGLTDDICTLLLEDLGTAATCSTWTPPGTPPPAGSVSKGPCIPPAPIGHRVLARSVWCTVACQEEIEGKLPAGTVVSTPALFTYYATGSAGTSLAPSMDDRTVAGGNALVDIHDVSMNVSVITDAVSHAPNGSGRVMSKATGNLFLSGTETSS